MKKLYIGFSIFACLLFSINSKSQTLTVAGTATPPTCNNGNNGSISVNVSGCPGPYTITSNPALTFSNGVANNVSPGTYQISATSPGSGGIQPLYTTNFATATDWQLNVVTGAEGSSPNPWFIGTGAGPSPASCGTSSTTALFIKCTGFICDIFGQGGPVYNASSAANNSNRAAHLNTDINTTGYTNINLKFAWKCGGSPQSFGTVRYSINGGSSWIDLPTIYNNNSNWTCANVALPVTTENIPNLRIGFKWVNGNNSGDTDPPFTITNVIVEGTGSGGAGCNGTTSVTVNNPAPATFTLNASGPLSLCSGQSVTLTAPAGVNNVTWSNGTNANAITVNSAGTYSATGTNAQGCTATSNQVNVTVDNNVGLMNVTANGPLTLCQGQSVTLTAEAGTTNLNWSNGETTPSITVTTAGTYSATGNNAIGCAVASVDFVVNIDNTIGLLAVTPDGSLSICDGQTVTLTADPNATNVIWSNGEFGNTLEIGLAGTYSATAQNASGCALASEEFTVTIGQTEPGEINVTPASPVEFCEGTSVVLTAAAGFSNYVWSNQTSGNTISVNQAGEYVVTALNNDGCLASSFPVIVNEINVPIASFTYEQTNGYNIQFTNTSTDGSEFLWTFTSGNTSTQTNPTFNFPFDGTYPVTLVVTNACGTNTITIDVVVEKFESVLEIEALNNITLMPNPTVDFTIIAGISAKPEQYKASLYNSIGQVINAETWAVAGSWQKNINLNQLPKGIYWLTIENKFGSVTKRIVKI